MSSARLDDQFADETTGWVAEFMGSAKSAIARKPAATGITVLGVATFGMVLSNALFFQDQSHPSAFFSTRAAPAAHQLTNDERALPVEQQAASNSADDTTAAPVTKIVFDPDARLPAPTEKPDAVPTTVRTVESLIADNQSPVVAPGRDETLAGLQALLKDLGFYKGEVDGLTGPKTRAAIDAYKASVGLRGIDLSYAELKTSAENNLMVTAAIPTSRPAPQAEQVTPSAVERASDGATPYIPPSSEPSNTQNAAASQISQQVLMVQAGLRAFGNDSVTVDGVMGSQTSAAIEEFQKLFDLPVSGTIDQQLLDKMSSVGLIN